MLRPGNAGALHHAGQVEVISSLHRDGAPVRNDLRWGVYVVFEAPNDYTVRCFKEYGVVTDPSGRISALYRPFHLIGLELNVSILSAALRGEATGAPTGFRGDVVATAKRDLQRRRDRWMARAAPASGASCCRRPTVCEIGGLPIGLANKLPLKRDIPCGAPVTWADVRVDETDSATRYRRDMEAAFA